MSHLGVGDCREHAMLHETVVIVLLNPFVQICKEVANKKGIHGEKICLYLVSYEMLLGPWIIERLSIIALLIELWNKAAAVV